MGHLVCVCLFASHLFWTSSSLDVPAGVTQEGHTGFLIHLSSAVHAFIFLARRIQPFLSLVDHEVVVRLNLLSNTRHELNYKKNTYYSCTYVVWHKNLRCPIAHRRGKADERSCVTFLSCDPGWYAQQA